MKELGELVADQVDIDRDARVLERRQADAQGPLDERRAVLRLAFADDGGKGRVADDEPFDDDPFAVDTNLAGRELDDAGFHGRIVDGGCDS
jgi:hypothetical protein